MDNIGMNAIKYLLFFFNLIFLISGIGIIAAGAYVVNEMRPYSYFLEDRILTPPIILIVIGVIVFLIAFLGCFGAIKENFMMLMAFAAALFVIFIIEISIGIAAAVFVSNFRDILKKSLKESIENNSNADKVAWENIQNSLRCCGVESKYDWNTVMPDGALPYSCCVHVNNSSKLECTTDSEYVYRNSCFQLLGMKVAANAKLLIGVGIGIAFVEVAGIVLACCLAMAIRRETNK